MPVGGPRITFGTLCQLVGIVSKETDHCLGWLEEGGEMALVPNLDVKHTFGGDEQLVIDAAHRGGRGGAVANSDAADDLRRMTGDPHGRAPALRAGLFFSIISCHGPP